MASWKCTQFMAQRFEGCAANPASLTVKPHQSINRLVHAGYKNPIGVHRSLEQLVRLGLFWLLQQLYRSQHLGGLLRIGW